MRNQRNSIEPESTGSVQRCETPGISACLCRIETNGIVLLFVALLFSRANYQTRQLNKKKEGDRSSRRGAARCCRLSPLQTGLAGFPHPASPERLLTGHYELAMRPVTFFRRCVVVRSGESQAAHRSSSITTFWQGPFAPPALPSFLATTNPSDSRSGHLPVIYSQQVLPPSAPAADDTRPGLPSSVVDLSTPAVLSHPGEPVRCFRSLLHEQCWLRRIRLVGHSQLRNEAVSGSHDITADVFVRRRLRRRDRSRRRRGNYMCVEQFT